MAAVGSGRQPTATRQTIDAQRVLDVSASLFSELGYKGTNLDLVAGRLGVTRQALYYYFPSKPAILEALLADAMSRLEAAIAPIDREGSNDRFIPMLQSHLQVTIQNRALVSLLLREHGELRRFPAAFARRRAYRACFVAAYSDGVAAGLLLDHDPDLATDITLTGANYFTTIKPSTRIANVVVAAESVLSILTDGLAAKHL
jgi:TetR/AcrR family transcriptional regulator, cholesterol catabolism regulator